jgi:hypothetical protein
MHGQQNFKLHRSSADFIYRQMKGAWYMIMICKRYRRYVGRVAQSVYRVATGWTVRGTNPDGGENFRSRPDQPWGPPSLLYNGYRVFPGGKAAGAW